jgi:hypothetical protein
MQDSSAKYSAPASTPPFANQKCKSRCYAGNARNKEIQDRVMFDSSEAERSVVNGREDGSGHIVSSIHGH